MSSKNLNRRLERLEAEVTPRDKKVMTLNVTFIGLLKGTRPSNCAAWSRKPDGDGGRGAVGASRQSAVADDNLTHRVRRSEG